MIFDEDLNRLRPLIGEPRARKLWRAYQMEDRDGRENLHAWVRMKLDKLVHTPGLPIGSGLSRLNEQAARGDIILGDIRADFKDESYPFGLRFPELLQHAGIFGRSGSGKTNLTAQLLLQLQRHGTPFLVFDWKRNYRDMLCSEPALNIQVYTVGQATCPFRFNPLAPPPGTSPRVWLKKLIEVACSAFYLGEGVSFLLQDAIDRAYLEAGIYDDTAARYPDMKTVYEYVATLNMKGRKAMWLDSTLRALQTLCFGPISDVINASADITSLDQMLQGAVVLELDALAHAEKVFFIETLLIWIHHYRLTQTERERLKHVIVIEEAHNILHVEDKFDIVNTLLREIRELGEGVILVDQHPSQLSVPAMGNTYTTIALNTKHERDSYALGEAMQVKPGERHLFSELPVGTALVKMQGRFMLPFLLHIPKVNIRKGSVTDQFLAQKSKRADSGDSEEVKTGKALVSRPEVVPVVHEKKNSGAEHPLPELEERLLKDVLAHPYDGVVCRYSRLNVSRRRGDGAKKQLLAKGVLEGVPVATRSGTVLLLQPTDKMTDALVRYGKAKRHLRKEGGIKHRYWIHRLQAHYENKGYSTQIEKRLETGGYVDLHAEKEGERIAVEVETGTPDINNIKKNLRAGYDRVVVYFAGPVASQQCTKIKSTFDASSICLVNLKEVI